MGRRRNKLRNAVSLIGLSFFRHESRIVKIAHIGSSTRSEDQFLNAKVQFILVPPPHFQLVSPHFVCFGDGTGCDGMVGNIHSNLTHHIGDAILVLSYKTKLQ